MYLSTGRLGATWMGYNLALDQVGQEDRWDPTYIVPSLLGLSHIEPPGAHTTFPTCSVLHRGKALARDRGEWTRESLARCWEQIQSQPSCCPGQEPQLRFLRSPEF